MEMLATCVVSRELKTALALGSAKGHSHFRKYLKFIIYMTIYFLLISSSFDGALARSKWNGIGPEMHSAMAYLGFATCQ